MFLFMINVIATIIVEIYPDDGNPNLKFFLNKNIETFAPIKPKNATLPTKIKDIPAIMPAINNAWKFIDFTFIPNSAAISELEEIMRNLFIIKNIHIIEIAKNANAT